MLRENSFRLVRRLWHRLQKTLTASSPIALTLDFPTPNMRIFIPSSLKVQGWAYSTHSPIQAIEVYQGARLLATLPIGKERPDVAQHLETNDALYSGFYGVVLLDDSLPSHFLLTLKATDEGHNIRMIDRLISLQRSDVALHVDYPSENAEIIGSELHVRGRVFSMNEELSGIHVLIDGEHRHTLHWDSEKAAPPAFESRLSLQGLDNGTHDLIVEAETTLGTRYAVHRRVLLRENPIHFFLQSPRASARIEGIDQLTIVGWTFSHAGKIKQVTAAIVNHTKITSLNYGAFRPEVSRALGHPRALTSGFYGVLDVRGVPNGVQLLVLRVLDATGIQLEHSVELLFGSDVHGTSLGEQTTLIDKPYLRLSIDTPQPLEDVTLERTMEINGWAFSQRGKITTIDVLLADQWVTQLRYGVYRPDVAKHYGSENMEYSGFHGRFRLVDFQTGEQVLEVRATDEHGNIISKQMTIILQQRKATEFQVEKVTWENGRLTVAGWVYCPGYQPPLLLQVYDEDVLLGQARVNLSRPDIAVLFADDIPDACRGFGFSTLYAPRDDASKSLRVAVVDHDNQEIIHTVEITPSGYKQAGRLYDQMRQYFALCQALVESTLSVLNWNTRWDHMDAYNATVFTPHAGVNGAHLPYFDDSIDIVLIASQGTYGEALRVARLAVILLSTEHDEVSIFWKNSPIERKQESVSIIIPVYGQLEYTLACLECLERTVPENIPIEVIVVDDYSPDQSLSVLREKASCWPKLRIAANSQNLGFVGSCNHGAEIAEHDYLIFLNNDTLPHSGWLEALIRTFRQNIDAGAVGGKLVFPDGTLQEAGGMVFSDGSAHNFGRGNPMIDHPHYQHVREVDYCSGALLATTRALFHQLGGFDQRFSPAYYEDTDYCFKVRQAGHKVYYQPESVVTHFEGMTSGTDVASGVKRYQSINAQKFYEKWQEVLQHHPAPPFTWDSRTLTQLLLGRTTIEDV